MSKASSETQLSTVFWVGMGLLVFSNFDKLREVPVPTAQSVLMIGVACMYPMYLWCEGKAKGMPVYPFFALTYLWTFCLPLLTENKNIWQYSPEQHRFAALTVTLFLSSGTFIWYKIVKRATEPRIYMALATEGAESFFIFMVAMGAFINMYTVGGWRFIPPALFNILGKAVLGLSFLGIFMLAYRAGSGKMGKWKIYLFFIVLCLNIISAAAGLILKTALTLFLLSTFAFVVGGRRLPLLPMTLGILLLLPLHHGKHAMRHKYWEGPAHFVQPWEYPAWFSEWRKYADEGQNSEAVRYEEPEEEGESFLERSSVIHMLMMAQTKIPQDYPYLAGETYSYVPILIVPRAFIKNKPVSHIGTHTLNVHIERQTWEQTEKTTIAWGLLPEAYANFGLPGAIVVGAFFGFFYGSMTAISVGTSAFSTRSMFTVLILSFALASTEWTAGVYAAALFQSTVPILGMGIFMKIYRKKKKKYFPNRSLSGINLSERKIFRT
ncbi:MAG: Protein of unknown function (DUF677) [Phormidesmis priestleyi Ana]|uniref:O-antigen polysaccharide polymerase Wzy n=1 Tax=Phormidesmis priestleyi Ana TaxID=1666911 RepID=A0A0N8KM79_9CYAN|nr:MAG: Protein of unknown function (DUF677) [Phormidesmis priestleyi Ana]